MVCGMTCAFTQDSISQNFKKRGSVMKLKPRSTALMRVVVFGLASRGDVILGAGAGVFTWPLTFMRSSIEPRKITVKSALRASHAQRGPRHPKRPQAWAQGFVGVTGTQAQRTRLCAWRGVPAGACSRDSRSVTDQRWRS
jgi:hypothetical protein